MKRTLVVILIGIAIATLGFVPGMGIPGALTLVVADPVATLIWGQRVQHALEVAGDNAWVVALALTPAAGAALIVAWFLAIPAFPRIRINRTWRTIVIYIVLLIIVGCFGDAWMMQETKTK